MAAWTSIPDSDLDPESPITTSLMLALRDNPIAIIEGASGAPPLTGGIKADSIDERTTGAGVSIDSVVGSAKAGTGENLFFKVIEIGDWNMDADPSVSVAHGLTATKIRAILSVYIRADALNVYETLDTPTLAFGQLVQGTASWDVTNVVLERDTGGAFDNTSYDSTSFNRGWITILHVP